MERPLAGGSNQWWCVQRTELPLTHDWRHTAEGPVSACIAFRVLAQRVGDEFACPRRAYHLRVAVGEHVSDLEVSVATPFVAGKDIPTVVVGKVTEHHTARVAV